MGEILFDYASGKHKLICINISLHGDSVSLPRVKLFPFVRVLHQFLMRGLDLLSDLRECESGGLQHLMGLVAFWKLLAELLHVL